MAARLIHGARRAAAAAALAVSIPCVAQAHGSMQIGDFYGGLSHPLFHPEALLLVIAVLLWSAQRGAPLLLRVPLAFALSLSAGSALASAGVALPATPWITRASALAIGALVALDVGAPGPVAVAASIALGVASGHDATWADSASIVRPGLFALGLGAGVLVAWGWIGSFALRFRAFWAEVAIRVAGSWIAAVALLVSALALARP